MHGLTVLQAPAPEEAQIGRTAVESIIKEARSVSPSDSGKCANAQALARMCRHPANQESADTRSTMGRSAPLDRTRRT